MAAFTLQWQHWVVTTETFWDTKPKYICIWPFIEKGGWLLTFGNGGHAKQRNKTENRRSLGPPGLHGVKPPWNPGSGTSRLSCGSETNTSLFKPLFHNLVDSVVAPIPQPFLIPPAMRLYSSSHKRQRILPQPLPLVFISINIRDLKCISAVELVLLCLLLPWGETDLLTCRPLTNGFLVTQP